MIAVALICAEGILVDYQSALKKIKNRPSDPALSKQWSYDRLPIVNLCQVDQVSNFMVVGNE